MNADSERGSRGNKWLAGWGPALDRWPGKALEEVLVIITTITITLLHNNIFIIIVVVIFMEAVVRARDVNETFK